MDSYSQTASGSWLFWTQEAEKSYRVLALKLNTNRRYRLPMCPRRVNQRIAWRHSSASFSRMGRLRLYMFKVWGLYGLPVCLSRSCGLLRAWRSWTTLLILLRYWFRSHSGLRPQSTMKLMYLPLFMVSCRGSQITHIVLANRPDLLSTSSGKKSFRMISSQSSSIQSNPVSLETPLHLSVPIHKE